MQLCVALHVSATQGMTELDSGDHSVLRCEGDNEKAIAACHMQCQALCVSLHVCVSRRRSGADSSVALQGLPWSPRWDADEMAARLFNFVKQQAPHAVRQLAAAAGGTAGSSL